MNTELTERLLNDAGGWQTMKEARGLHGLGRVSDATWQDPLLQGRVREGETEYRSGLRIKTRTDIENICGCRASRQRGAICAHSIAVGLQVLNPKRDAPAPAPPVEPAKPPSSEKPPSRFQSGDGEPAEISIVLPPNLAAAWDRGSITASFEASVGGKRMPLQALPKDRAFSLSEADLRVTAMLHGLAGEEAPGMAMFNCSQFARFLESIESHPRVALGKGGLLAMDSEPLLPRLILDQASDCLRLRVELPADGVLLGGAGPLWWLSGVTLRRIAPGLSPAYHALLRSEIVIPAAQAGLFLQRELPGLRNAFVFDEPTAPEEPAVERLQPHFTLQIEGSLNHLAATLRAQYGEHAPFSLPAAHARGFQNPEAETAAVSRLQSAGFVASKTEFILKGEAHILAFFARDLPWWERHGKVKIGARFAHVTRDVERVQPVLEIRSSGENWFELQVDLATAAGDRFSAADIQRLIQGGQSHVRQKNGKLAVFDPGMLDDFQQVLRDCDPNQKQPGLYRIDNRHAAYLESTTTEQGAKLNAPAEWRSWATASRKLDGLRPIPLGKLEEILRPYQKHGVYWLNFLAMSGLGGILADEMGLGKTIQALGFAEALPGKTLIVCPSSLVYNWAREAERFTPGRRVLPIEGAARDALFGAPLREADLVVTSYSLLRRDIERYKGVVFETAILDEAQHIKNPDSQNARSAFAIRSKNRFVLTGTPVENSVRDIWSLMNFAMPGYLGTKNDFRERFEIPITSNPGGPEHQRLVKRLQPFVLRRLKRDVITELPEKIEQVSYCELNAAQKEAYAELLSAARRTAADLAGSKQQGQGRMVMLTALLRLRQVCCDLRLLDIESDQNAEPAGKVALLGELLQEAADGGHRVLVFSQFARMLGLLKELLTEQEVDHCHLDGSTRGRAAQVDRFQKGDVPVFLVSLKAGGVGLNLTAADTVIHFDPWWNPAVEAQATDRAHRIGQKKVVTAYKLIARGTVEEKILALQAKKRQVIDATIENEQPLMNGLSMADIEALLN